MSQPLGRSAILQSYAFDKLRCPHVRACARYHDCQQTHDAPAPRVGAVVDSEGCSILCLSFELNPAVELIDERPRPDGTSDTTDAMAWLDHMDEHGVPPADITKPPEEALARVRAWRRPDDS